MSWIDRFDSFYNLISNGKIPASSKATLVTLNGLTVKYHRMINYYNNHLYVKSGQTKVASPLAIVDDYNEVYDDFQTVMTAALADLTTDYTISDVSAFTDLLERMNFSEGFILYLASKGEIQDVKLRILASLSASGTAGEVAMFEGGIYEYGSSAWSRKPLRAYKGSLSTFPAGQNGDYFIPNANGVHTSGLSINGEQLLINGEDLNISRAVKKAEVHYFNSQWLPDRNPDTSWRYASAFEEYNTLLNDYPDVIDNRKAKAMRNINKNLGKTQTDITNINTVISAHTTLIGRVDTAANAGESGAQTLNTSIATMKSNLDDIVESIGDFIDEN